MCQACRNSAIPWSLLECGNGLTQSKSSQSQFLHLLTTWAMCKIKGTCPRLSAGAQAADWAKHWASSHACQACTAAWKDRDRHVRVRFAQVASLIMQRNVLAARLGRNRSLPPVLGDPQACSRCFQVSNCSLLHKVIAPHADRIDHFQKVHLVVAGPHTGQVDSPPFWHGVLTCS